MILRPCEISGAYVVELQPRRDDRGSFARAWCRREFEAAGLTSDFVQWNVARSHRKGTLRGLHYQLSPHAETKLIYCTRGAVYDVLVDLRSASPTFREWVGVELTADDRRMVYVPEGCAHGYLTLADDCEVTYMVSAFYAPDAERGVRYDDPEFQIHWPLPVSAISRKDRCWPAFEGHGA